MPDKAAVIDLIRQAFREPEHPGDHFLQGSREGCEPYEAVAPFFGITDWQQVDPAILDPNYTALSFFSEGGFRYFLPAFLIADLEDRLDTADPVFHLTHGFSDRVVTRSAGGRAHKKKFGKSAFVNPKRYGAMTSCDYARYRLAIFAREEARAIVAYLEYKRGVDQDGLYTDDITAALDSFWYHRAGHAPEQKDLRADMVAEEQYMKDLQEKK